VLTVSALSACAAVPEQVKELPSQDAQSLSGEAAPAETGADSTAANTGSASTDAEIAALFNGRQSDVYVTGTGSVEKILSDDNVGDRHQRFILRLDSGQTLLIAHNIDIAPRVEPLGVGDEVRFAGIYEYNDEGGVIHWTHHDPDGEHVSGYIQTSDRDFR
jgi:hypothetical protein